ncbi:hypothetical protein K491DRAFT_671865 [Lophiostoma macrostomum CBS 122681]|uniref:Uncharacterized protein n=1 Tax=Lophiostoma macrostomum CBS 122681 TaxID=1314788 RepID=A0A6A6SKY4_9PLEO|nr:hypothetical protein K491DRAFT_671865 [Lophiostoma macrostomum CBS 122681]
MSDLPPAVRRTIMTIFDNAFRNKKENLAKLEIMLRNHLNPLENGVCVRNQVLDCNKVPMSFTKSGNDDQSACNACLNRRRPCVRLIRRNGAVHLALYPLHVDYRAGASWKDLDFWIRRDDVA